MTTNEQLDLLFEQNHGIVKTAQVLEHGIAKHTFYAYAKKNGIEQVAHGIYIAPNAWTLMQPLKAQLSALRKWRI